MTALSGVRSSWLMLARKPLFAWLAVSAASFATCISRCARSRSSTSRRMPHVRLHQLARALLDPVLQIRVRRAQRLLRRLARR